VHYGRIIAIVGSVLAVVGFTPKSATSTAEYIFRGLTSINPGFPERFDSVFVSLWSESAPAAGILVLSLVAVLGLSLTPKVKSALSRRRSLIVTVLGVVMLVIGGIATKGASEKMDTLEAGFASVAAIGLINEGHTATISWGWYLLMCAGALVVIGGVVQLLVRPQASTQNE